VLVRGESGTGKELVARTLFQLSDRRDRPFVKVNCAALPSELLESELFGFEKGAFTGAQKRKLGKFEYANQGTIFLDEISEMHPGLQAKLLQVLQDGEFSRLGGESDVHVDTRIIAATNCNLEEAVAKGTFREDLYYRLNVVTVHLPPLRDRMDGVPLLVDHFLQKNNEQYRKNLRAHGRPGKRAGGAAGDRRARHGVPPGGQRGARGAGSRLARGRPRERRRNRSQGDLAACRSSCRETSHRARPPADPVESQGSR
jgi:transcriptional regulator with AAA-type ATPase domain